MPKFQYSLSLLTYSDSFQYLLFFIFYPFLQCCKHIKIVDDSNYDYQKKDYVISSKVLTLRKDLLSNQRKIKAKSNNNNKKCEHTKKHQNQNREFSQSTNVNS